MLGDDQRRRPRIFVRPKGVIQYETARSTSSAAGMVAGHGRGGGPGGRGRATAATQSQRQLRRTARKVMKGAENAVMQLDKMAADFVEKHIDC